MKTSSFKVHLGLWFILAVILPSLVLGGLAIRTVNQEEAYVEKRLEDSLLAEVNHTAALIRTELAAIQKELEDTQKIIPAGFTDGEKDAAWRKASTLVAVPFFISNDRSIRWPATGTALPPEENFFLKWSADFLTDRESTPVYENIASVYKDKIIQESQPYQQKSNTYQTKGDSSWGWGRLSRGQQELQDDIGEQYSAASLQQYEPVYQKTYDTARKEGQQVVKRQVIPQKSMKSFQTSSYEPEESIFIADDLTFSQIRQKQDKGIIPFIVKEKLRLLFWKKEPGGITGCLLDGDAVTARVVRLLPGIYTDARILTVLDENGKPVITPNEDPRRDWNRPFVAAEISEVLPRWEVAAYLTNPDAISSKAQTTKLLVWVLILILLISIITGGTLVLRSLDSEIRIAQQKTTFAANVSHELKTPLTSIRMFTEMLKDNRQPDEAKRRQYFEITLSEIERLTRLINNVLDFSRTGRAKKTYHFETIDLVGLCRAAVEGQRMRLEYGGFSVGFASKETSLPVKADAEALKQVLINILSNAEKYSADKRAIEVDVLRQDGTAVILIKDQGIGIPRGHAEKIFEEFYRVDDSLSAKTQGTGLGLTIARRIAREHGGDILYFPREGQGSIFQIKLPIIKENA